MQADLLTIGKALSARARVAMIDVLLDGDTHTAGALGAAAGVTSATASEHLAVLVGSGLVTVTQDGRFRRYRLADRGTAEALESLSGENPVIRVSSLRLSREQRRVQTARTCYDHLAGKLGVAVTEMLFERRWISPAFEGVTADGVAGFATLGIDIDQLRKQRRPLLRVCQDWTERRAHLAGSVGAAIATAALDRRWVTRREGSRGLDITPSGRRDLGDLGVVLVKDERHPAADDAQ